MSESCRELCEAAAGMTVDELTAEIQASERETRDPQVLAAYLLSMAD